MDLKHLRCFVTVAEELHYGRAAARLHMAPSALSRHIRMLEEELDVRLFSRTTRSVILTRAGTVFLDEAKAILQRTKAAQRTAQEAALDDGEVLRIGALDSATASIRFAALPERGVTVRSGDMGYTMGPFAGSAKCPGRRVNPWTND